MNKETYEALKRIITQAEGEWYANPERQEMKDIGVIKDWIDEVAKEYEE